MHVISTFPDSRYADIRDPYLPNTVAQLDTSESDATSLHRDKIN